MGAIRISEADAARDFASLMAHIRAGNEVMIENESTPVAVLRNLPSTVPARTLSETIARMKARADERGYSSVVSSVMDADYAADMEEIVANRKPLRTPSMV